MKGMLVKDFKLMKGHRNFFATIAVMAIGMAIFMDKPSFVIGYMTFVGSLFTLSTISYDEFDNGNAFLFSLPISRKGYTVEKYGFGLITGGVSWLFATVFSGIAGVLKNTVMVKDTVMIALLVLPALMILLAVMLPFQFRFGGEKGRIAMLGAVCLMYAAAFAAVRAAGRFHVDLISVWNRLLAVSTGKFLAGIFGTAIAGLLISLKISIAIMNKKEF